MTREEKGLIIEELKTKLEENSNFYITDASGLSVEQINEFRRLCFEAGVEYGVYKNTLIQKALEKLDTDYAEFTETVLKGFSGIIFSKEAANAPAQVIRNYRKSGMSDDKPMLKGASIDTDLFIGEEHLKLLSELKSKNELIGEIIMLLQSPAKNVISALQSGGGTLAGLVKTLSEREQ
ncbi:MAG: 50S ribosomal protein L10 [Bacteroidota bacterium]